MFRCVKAGILGICLISTSIVSGQYILNGTATQNTCNCYTLTQALNWQAGSVWNATKIDLTRPFDFVFNVYLGCLDANGADGIVFMLQPISTSLGAGGGGMGFQNVTPSIGITLDTWQNTEFNDPSYDHISIQANGVIQHGTDLAGPVQASAASVNIEDCAWHTFRITWDPTTFNLKAYFDGDLRVEVSNNIIATTFNNDPMVYWGFSSATGGAFNVQQFCTALDPLFVTNQGNDDACIGDVITFGDASQSFAPIQSWAWDFGDGNTSNAQHPTHLYAQPGNYPVSLTITGLDGCVSQPFTKNVVIGSYPMPVIEAHDTCHGQRPRLLDRSTNEVGVINSWEWYLDGSLVSTSQNPSLPGIAPGIHTLKLVVESIINCQSDTAYATFEILPRPDVDAIVADGCVNKPISLSGVNVNGNSIDQWQWNFGDGQNASQQNINHTYTSPGTYQTALWAIGSNGCTSDTAYNEVFINNAVANAGRDTMILKDIPFTLNGGGGGSYQWSPTVGLSDASIANPVAVLSDDQTYFLTVTTPEGCVDTDTVHIKVFKGSAIYVPTGFTPNSDGKNDILKPMYIGIRKLDYFRIFNRWGEMVFQTNDTGMGWSGLLRGMNQPTGTFVWMLKAEDYAGKIYVMHGTTTIIR